MLYWGGPSETRQDVAGAPLVSSHDDVTHARPRDLPPQVSSPASPDDIAQLDAIAPDVAGERYPEGGMRTLNR